MKHGFRIEFPSGRCALVVRRHVSCDWAYGIYHRFVFLSGDYAFPSPRNAVRAAFKRESEIAKDSLAFFVNSTLKGEFHG